MKLRYSPCDAHKGIVEIFRGRRQIGDRPAEANEAKESGHLEMNTVVLRRGSHGGLVVMLDRHSRRYIIEHLDYINHRARLSRQSSA